MPILYATGLQFHLSAATEDSTTKDTTDTNGAWNEYDVTQRSGDIQFDALLSVDDDANAIMSYDLIDEITDTEIEWELAIVGGANNRVVSTVICTGKGKITNISPSGQVGQKAVYSGTISTYGPITVAA